MINTMNNIVTTNLRIPAEDLMQYKMIAGEMGMSFNEYCNWVMRDVTSKISLGNDLNDISKKRNISIWDLPNLAKKIKSEPMGMSSNDEAVYY